MVVLIILKAKRFSSGSFCSVHSYLTIFCWVLVSTSTWLWWGCSHVTKQFLSTRWTSSASTQLFRYGPEGSIRPYKVRASPTDCPSLTVCIALVPVCRVWFAPVSCIAWAPHWLLLGLNSFKKAAHVTQRSVSLTRFPALYKLIWHGKRDAKDAAGKLQRKDMKVQSLCVHQLRISQN